MSLCHISFIVPVYNTGWNLNTCLTSLLRQSLREIEVIAVDDGSPDDSPRLLDEFAKKDPRLTVLHIPNQGVSVARNTGAARARGEYLWFVDSDDYIEPECARQLYEHGEKAGADLVLFDRREHTADSTRRFPVDLPLSGEKTLCLSSRPDLLARMTPFSCDKLIRRSLWERAAVSFPAGIRYEDIPVSLPLCAMADAIAYLPQVCYHYQRFQSFRSRSTDHAEDLPRALDLLEMEMTARGLLPMYEDALVYLNVRHTFYRFHDMLKDTVASSDEEKQAILRLYFRRLDNKWPTWRTSPLLDRCLPLDLAIFRPLFSKEERLSQIYTETAKNTEEVQERYVKKLRNSLWAKKRPLQYLAYQAYRLTLRHLRKR